MAKGGGAYRVIIVPEARDVFQQTVNYLEENVSAQSAETLRNAIIDSLDKVAKNPYSYGPVKELANEDEIIYRRILVQKAKYRVIYIVSESSKEVKVVDISRSDKGPNYLKKLLQR